MSATELLALKRTSRFPVSRETVFRAWTNPEELKRWWRPGLYTTDRCEIDLRTGGRYFISMRDQKGTVVSISGTYLEVRAPERLVMTWLPEGGRDHGHESLLTLEFIDVAGSTELRLTHERLPAASSGNYDSGWTSVLDQLQVLMTEKVA